MPSVGAIPTPLSGLLISQLDQKSFMYSSTKTYSTFIKLHIASNEPDFNCRLKFVKHVFA